MFYVSRTHQNLHQTPNSHGIHFLPIESIKLNKKVNEPIETLKKAIEPNKTWKEATEPN